LECAAATPAGEALTVRSQPGPFWQTGPPPASASTTRTAWPSCWASCGRRAPASRRPRWQTGCRRGHILAFPRAAGPGGSVPFRAGGRWRPGRAPRFPLVSPTAAFPAVADRIPSPVRIRCNWRHRRRRNDGWCQGAEPRQRHWPFRCRWTLASIAILDVVSRKWLATVTRAEDSSVQVEVAFLAGPDAGTCWSWPASWPPPRCGRRSPAATATPCTAWPAAGRCRCCWP